MPNILILDIETAPLEANVWKIWDENVGLNQLREDWSILAYAAKWLNNDEVMYADTSGRGKRRVRDDRHLLKGLYRLLDAADIVVAQGAARFDIRKINARLLTEGYGPYSPIRVVDTLTILKRLFGFTSNKLEWIAQQILNHKKDLHPRFHGFELWLECLKDNPEAWADMKRYNIGDVLACEELYLKLRPWIVNHPNVGAYERGEVPTCPKCGSASIQKRGPAVTQQGRFQRYQCNDCGGWSRSKQLDLTKEERSILLV